MKKTILFLILIIIGCICLPLMAKRTLTAEQIADANDFIASIQDDPNTAWVVKLYNSRDFPKTRKELEGLEIFRQKVVAGAYSKVVDGNDVTLTMDDLWQCTGCIDREFHSDPNILLDVLTGKRSRLTGKLYSSEGEPNEI